MNAVLKRLIGCGATCLALSWPMTVLGGNGEDQREGGLTGTGIVGEITALGSIWVNEHRIVLPADVPLTSAINTTSPNALVAGDVVAVSVKREADTWVAQEVTHIHPLIGPVTDVTDTSLTILGVQVALPANVRAIRVGDHVAVSGFWSNGRVKATRVVLVDDNASTSLLGSYSERANGAGFNIGPVYLDIDPLQHAREGDVVQAQGRWQDGAFVVTDIHLGLFKHPRAIVLAEGYLSDVAPSGHYTVSGSGLSSFTDNPETIMPQERITVCGVHGTLLHSVDSVSTEEQNVLDALGCRLDDAQQ